MKNIIKKLFNSVKASVDVVAVVVDVVLVVALIPIMAVFINSKNYVCENASIPTLYAIDQCTGNGTSNASATVYGASATELTVLSLTALFIVLAIVFNVVKQSGLMKK